MTKRVRKDALYRFDPVPLDRIDPPAGVLRGELKAGNIVRVVKMPGCPPPNTMGHCHVSTPAGMFLGLVHCNSLKSRT